ncbi:MAG: radical SAM protein [Chloroflexi bacterium]|nr:radical SAM protein [Chloroflexota bacterium]
MKILFVYSDISGAEHYGAKKYYSGIGSLSAVLRAAGHSTELIYLQSEPDRDAFVTQVQQVAPGLVAFSSTTHQYPYIERYAGYLREALPEVPRVCGGTHPTLVPEQVVTSSAFDVVCVGEGEYPLRDLAERLERGDDYTDVPNLWMRRGDEIIRNPLRPLIADLDELPYVDRELFDYGTMLAANDGWVDIMSGRGCPYECSYCCNPGLKACYHGLGKYVRFRSVSHVLGELHQLCERYKVKTVNFQDDTFTLDRRWTLDFCQAYGAQVKLPFWINTRAERILDETLVRALAQAGCAGVRIGVENGDEALRASVLKRRMSNDDLVRAFKLLHQHGLKAYSCNMIGIPGETPATIQATIDLNRQLEPDEFQFSVFYPYPMTELHDTCVAQNLIQPGHAVSSYYAKESVLDLPTLSAEELARGYERFEALRAELALKRSSPLKHRLYRLLLTLYRDDGPRLQRHLAALRGKKR